MAVDSRKNLGNTALVNFTEEELGALLEDLGYGEDMNIIQDGPLGAMNAAREAWELSQWYKPDEHQLTKEEFRAKYNRNPKQFEDDGLEPGAI